MNASHATLRAFFNAEVECQVAGSHHDLFTTAVEETFMDAIKLRPDGVSLQRKLILNGRVHGSISLMIENELSDF